MPGRAGCAVEVYRLEVPVDESFPQVEVRLAASFDYRLFPGLVFARLIFLSALLLFALRLKNTLIPLIHSRVGDVTIYDYIAKQRGSPHD